MNASTLPEMKYSDVLDCILDLYSATPNVSVHVSGPPGVGKTHLSKDIHSAMRFDNVYIFRPSIHDPVDLLGLPAPEDGVTLWLPPAWLHKMQTGRNLLVIDEISQSQLMMKNALAGLILDRFIGDVHLSPDTYILTTGNEIQHKAGASANPGQLSNRWMHFRMMVDHEGWENWAINEGLDPMVLAFIRFRPGLLCAYQPDRENNPTPRSWEMVGRHLRNVTSISRLQYMVAGLVGEGAATEYVAYREVASKTPEPQECILHPKTAILPTELAAKYAITTCLAAFVDDVKSAESAITYMRRMEPEFQTLFFTDSKSRKTPATRTRAFIDWANTVGQAVLG